MRQPCSAGSKNWGPNHLKSESDQLAIRLYFILPGHVIFVHKGRIMYPTASMLLICLKEEYDIRGALLTYVFKGVPRCACGPLMSMSCFPEDFAFSQEPAIRQRCLHEGDALQAQCPLPGGARRGALPLRQVVGLRPHPPPSLVLPALHSPC